MALDVVCESAAFQVLHDQVDEMVLEYNVVQPDDILVASIGQFAQVAEGGDFAAEEVPGDFVVDGPEVDDLDGHPIVGVAPLEAQVDVAGGAFAEECRLADGVAVADGPCRAGLH
jgi:hypothetical protein